MCIESVGKRTIRLFFGAKPGRKRNDYRTKHLISFAAKIGKARIAG